MASIHKNVSIKWILNVSFALLSLSSNAIAFNSNDQTLAEDDGVENDSRARYALRKVIAPNMAVNYPDLYTFFAKTNKKTIPSVLLENGNILQNGIFDNPFEIQTAKRTSLMMVPSRRSPYKTFDILCNRCESGDTFIDFGADHFPRAAFQKICGASSACAGLYVCRPLIYTMSILKRRRGGEDAPDDGVPRSLQAGWTSVKKEVTVACLCAHPDN